MFNLLHHRNPSHQQSEATIRSTSIVIAVYFGSTTSLAIVRDSSLLEIITLHSIVFGVLAAVIFHKLG
jgi:hypothetical protein